MDIVVVVAGVYAAMALLTAVFIGVCGSDDTESLVAASLAWPVFLGLVVLLACAELGRKLGRFL